VGCAGGEGFGGALGFAALGEGVVAEEVIARRGAQAGVDGAAASPVKNAFAFEFFGGRFSPAHALDGEAARGGDEVFGGDPREQEFAPAVLEDAADIGPIDARRRFAAACGALRAGGAEVGEQKGIGAEDFEANAAGCGLFLHGGRVCC